MEIKNMKYTNVSGGTFTIGVQENGKLKNKEIDTPSKLVELITALETRVGEGIENITFQICPTQSLSEERLIINYKIEEGTFKNTKTILNVADMSFYEKVRYNDLLEQVK